MPEHEIIENARAFGRAAHQGQYYSDEPYHVHLDAVEEQLRRFGFSPEEHPVLFAGAHLHDVVEDTGVTLEEIRARFGRAVAALVDALTDPDGDTREEKKAGVYKKIRAHDDGVGPLATALKLADRIANVSVAVERRRWRKFRMYQDEMAGFEEALCVPGELEPMWDALRNLFSSAAQ